jgi:hypothetical protein
VVAIGLTRLPRAGRVEPEAVGAGVAATELAEEGDVDGSA